MIRFGISGLPPEDATDEEFLDGLVERGHRAYELAFVKGFPWNERRCGRFGELAAARDIALSVHAPYFAVLTVDDPERGKQTRAALEHTLKLGRALGARIIVAHTGYTRGRDPEELHALVDAGLETLTPKIATLGVALGLETSGTERAFGSLGDIALIAARYTFVRPVVDWAHVHAISGGALTSKEAFTSVIDFLRSQFPGWAIDPLHAQFTDNEFGPKGEIKHVPYGEGSLQVGPLIEAVRDAGLGMTLISEAHDEPSHDLIRDEVAATLAAAPEVDMAPGRPVGSGAVQFPGEVVATEDGDGWLAGAPGRTVRLRNIDKTFFPDAGYTKGDLIQYYATIAPTLLPHLAERAIVMARFPDGAEGSSFYEKQAPQHTPEWLTRAPLHSEHRGEAIEFVTAHDAESLLWLANMGCIEIHPWLSREQSWDRPDFAIFDLDPADDTTWQQVVDVARHVNLVLERLGLATYLKTSGATGLHIYVPLDNEYPYRRVRRFVATVGRLLVAADPANVTMEWDKSRRTGKVFIDHNQNVGGKTIASVYSVRPTPEASVSTPILWDELDAVSPADFTIATIWDRLQRFGDLFAPVLRGGQRLEGPEAALGIEAT